MTRRSERVLGYSLLPRILIETSQKWPKRNWRLSRRLVFDSARERAGVVPIRVLIEELRATTVVRVLVVMLWRSCVTESELIARTIPDNQEYACLLYTSPSPRDGLLSRM